MTSVVAPVALTSTVNARCRLTGVSRMSAVAWSENARLCAAMRARRGDSEFPDVEWRSDGRLFLEGDLDFDKEVDQAIGISQEEEKRPKAPPPSRKKERGLARKARAEAKQLEADSGSPAAEVRTHFRRRTSDYSGPRLSAEEARIARIREKKPPLEQQVYLPTQMTKDPHIAVIGGGMAGLVCALTLEERGIRSTVFDTGKHGLGGRMGTRHIVQTEGAPLLFDHAAQYFTVKDPKFQKLVDRWISEGAVSEWNGVVGLLREGNFTELPPCVKYVGTSGMRPLADHMVSKARLISVERPCWINSMEAVDGMWYLTENRVGHGNFDAVVIAHNGKCANRLLARSGAPMVAKQMKRLELSSIWALLAAFDEPLPCPSGGISIDGAFVEGVNSLSWMGNNNAKLRNGEEIHPNCWTFFSTAAYGKKHKCPQESIPNVKAERVRREMLLGAEMALGIPEGSLPVPIYTRVQIWGAALPTNTPNIPCIFDPHSRVGMCGDWLTGASLEAAALSGMSLAHHLADFCEKSEAGYFEEDGDKMKEFSMGLQAPLVNLDGHDIGQFPGAATPQKQDIQGRALLVPLEEKPLILGYL